MCRRDFHAKRLQQLFGERLDEDEVAKPELLGMFEVGAAGDCAG